MELKTQVLVEPQAREKLRQLPAVVADLLGGGQVAVPDTPGRDVQIVPIRALPPKKGLASVEGQARLIHDLASIELQAMELGVRTLSEFPKAPRSFRKELAQITLDEGRHFELCLNLLEDLGWPWGTHPVHVGLWQAVTSDDSLLDRILIVHRYLEGSGLDASDTLLRRLGGVRAPKVCEVVALIRHEEEEHVRFGSFWYHALARAAGLDPAHDFSERLTRLFSRIPRRLEPISREVRLSVGFTEAEIGTLEALRDGWMRP